VGRKKPTRKRDRAPKKASRWGFRGMTVRDWLPIVGALLIPVVIAAGSWRITWQQGKIEDQRAQTEQELAEQRAQDEALQAYLSQMSTLLLEKDLRSSDESSEVRTLARARTLTVLGRLDPSRKDAVLRFLWEAALIQRVAGRQPVISLVGADLSGTNLSLYDLRGVDWTGVDLSDATLQGANLYNADLRGAKLSDPDLSGANLTMAQGVTNEQLKQQAHSLEGATMPNGQKYEDWLKSKGSGVDGENSGPS
jgi:Pentapeptide repeats (8 copies)